MRADSDVDIGIIPQDPDVSLGIELDLQVRLETACARPVDLVRLDLASTLLRWEAARTAVLLMTDAPREFTRFIASAALDHAELMTTLGDAAERFRRRLADGHGSSPTDSESARR
jgi:hypothetical protein